MVSSPAVVCALASRALDSPNDARNPPGETPGEAPGITLRLAASSVWTLKRVSWTERCFVGSVASHTLAGDSSEPVENRTGRFVAVASEEDADADADADATVRSLVNSCLLMLVVKRAAVAVIAA